MSSFINDVEFKCEDALATLMPDASALGCPVVLSLSNSELEVDHVAIIAEGADPSEGLPRSGNWKVAARLKACTSLDQPGNVRALHRSRAGLVRDAVMRLDLAAVLSAAVADFTVQQFDFGKITTRIIGRSWVTEFELILDPVSCADL